MEETKNKYLRALADYQNLQRQTNEWKTEFVAFANEKLIRRLLEVVDDLERAGEQFPNQGLQLIINKFKKILADEGLSLLELEGKDYDPGLAEVIGTEPGKVENKIVIIAQKGYKLGEKVIRPGKVIVSQISH